MTYLGQKRKIDKKDPPKTMAKPAMRTIQRNKRDHGEHQDEDWERPNRNGLFRNAAINHNGWRLAFDRLRIF